MYIFNLNFLINLLKTKNPSFQLNCAVICEKKFISKKHEIF